MSRLIFQLKVQKIDLSCLFQLSWGQGQQLQAILTYPTQLTHFYQTWQQAYLAFYQSAVRGRVAETGSLTPVNRHRELVEAEAKLLSDFHRWLRSVELFDIRSEIARAAQELMKQAAKESQQQENSIDIFLTCHPIELERLPWEAWEIGTELAATCPIRLTRTPIQIREKTAREKERYRQGKTRVLVILGDDTGLNFKNDLEAIQILSKTTDIRLVSWHPEKNINSLTQEICDALIDQQGWDILFFIGHSNETEITGGELGISPDNSITIKEIAAQVKTAVKNGLKFAFFNSCSGLIIANNLIDLGLSQVAVMREPIHNQVAQSFLIKFLQNLIEYKDVHDAIREASQFFKQHQNITYPSAYLVPSLFCHPDTVLFRLQPFGWRQQLKRWFPTRKEGMLIGIFCFLSLLNPLQAFLLEGRILSQSFYRDITAQIPPAKPPVVLLQIDEQSLREAKIHSPNPIDRGYLADLINKLSQSQAKIIGIDYLLDRPHPKDNLLDLAIKHSFQERQIWFILASEKEKNQQETNLTESRVIADNNFIFQGYIEAFPEYVKLPESCFESCPFAYLTSLSYYIKSDSKMGERFFLNFDKQKTINLQLTNFMNFYPINNKIFRYFKPIKINPITYVSQYFSQEWLRPINDFSLPPNLIYTAIPAWQILKEKDLKTRFKDQIILIAPGGYQEAGVEQFGADNFPVPSAVAYWQERLQLKIGNPLVFTGSQAHAYMIHHFLTQHLVIPIPDLWMIGIVIIVGKGTILGLTKVKYPRQQNRTFFGLFSLNFIYIWASLQAYISVNVLLPIILPSLVFWIYILSSLRQKK